MLLLLLLHRQLQSSSSSVSSVSDHVNRCKIARSLPPESPTFATKPKFFDELLRNSTRSSEECIWLASGLPKAPAGYPLFKSTD